MQAYTIKTISRHHQVMGLPKNGASADQLHYLALSTEEKSEATAGDLPKLDRNG